MAGTAYAVTDAPTKGPVVIIHKGSSVEKAGIEGGGQYAQAISSRISLEQQSWQHTLLVNAGLHAWLYRTHPWVRAIVDRQAQAASADIYHIEPAEAQLTGVGNRKVSDTSNAENIRIAALRTVLNGIGVGGKPLRRLLKSVYTDLGINSNAYWRVIRKGRTPVAVGRVDFRIIAPNLDPESGQRTSYSIFKMGNFSMAPEIVPLEDIIHFQDNDLGEGGVGLSKLEALDSSLSLDIGAVQVNLGYMQNGTKSGDVYSFLPETLDPDGIERERLYLKDNFSKPSQSYSPLFMAGDIKLVKQGNVGRQDMDFHKLRDYTREEVASVYLMPLALLSTAVIGALGSSGKQEDNIAWNNDVVAPMQEVVFETLNDDLVRKTLRTQDMVLVPPQQSKLRLENAQFAELLVQIGGTGNQALRIMGLPDVDGLDTPLFLRRGAAMIGAPGHPDSAILTATGLVSGIIQDAAALASAGASPAGEVIDSQEANIPQQVPGRVKKGIGYER